MVLGLAARDTRPTLRLPKSQWVRYDSWHSGVAVMTKDDDRFVRQVRRVCDYLVASGSPHASELEDALSGYDDTENGVDQRNELRRAASKVFPTIEKRTLAAVLSGDFRLGEKNQTGRTSRLLAPTNVVAAFGVILIILSLHWTYWSTRASAVIASLDNVLEIHRNLNIEEIVYTRDFCQYQKTELDDQDVNRFILAVREMAHYDTVWYDSSQDAQYLTNEFWPFRQLFYAAKGAISGLLEDPEERSVQEKQLSVPVSSVGNKDDICEFFSKLEKRTLDTEYLWYESSYADLAKTIPLRQGSDVVFLVRVTANIEVQKRNLTELQLIVHRWILPTLHGALGAIIFCLVRAIREPFLVPFSPRDILLRSFFGAFVGYLVSALFVPFGMLGQTTAGAAPIASIAAFILGYSIDSFISLLNRMNRYIVELPEQKDPEKS